MKMSKNNFFLESFFNDFDDDEDKPSDQASVDKSTPLRPSNLSKLNRFSITPINCQGFRSSSKNLHYLDDSAYFSNCFHGTNSSLNLNTSDDSNYDFLQRQLFESEIETRVDILGELYNRQIFHVIQKILNNLPPKDYLNLTSVSRLWSNIIEDDRQHNAFKNEKILAMKEKYEGFKVLKLVVLNIIFLNFGKNILFG